MAEHSFTPDPSREDAAALIAAVERFIADTAPALSGPEEEGVSGWLRSGLAEGVGSRDQNALW